MGRKRTRRKSAPADPVDLAVDEAGSQSEPEWRAGGSLPRINRKRKLASLASSGVGDEGQSKNEDTSQAEKDASIGSPRRSSRKRTPIKQPVTRRPNKKPKATTPEAKSDSKISEDGSVKAEVKFSSIKNPEIVSSNNKSISKIQEAESKSDQSCAKIPEMQSKSDNSSAEVPITELMTNNANAKVPEIETKKNKCIPKIPETESKSDNSSAEITETESKTDNANVPETESEKENSKITKMKSESDKSNAEISETQSKRGRSSAKIPATESKSDKSSAQIPETESKTDNANVPEAESEKDNSKITKMKSESDKSNAKISETESKRGRSSAKIPETKSNKESSVKISRAKPRSRKTSANAIKRETKSVTVNSKKSQPKPPNDKVTTNKRGRKKGQQAKRGKKDTKRRMALPSFDDDDMFQTLEQEGADTCTKDTQSPENNTNITHSVMSSSLEVDVNGMLDHDEPDLESDASSDEDLPDVLSQESNKVNEGDIVWAKTRGFPFWPAVVKKLYKARSKAAVFFAGELNKSNQKGKGVSMKAMKPYSCPQKGAFIDAGLKHPKVTKEEFQEAIDLAENYITKRGLGKAQGASFFTTKDYSNVSPERTPSKSDLSIMYTPSMKAGLQDRPSSPLNPPCDSHDRSIMDLPIWKSGGALSVSQDQSIDDEGENQSMDDDEENSDVDEETMEKRKTLTKLQDRLLRYITKRPIVKEHLFKIFKGESKSLRHTLYCSAKSEDKTKLKYLRGFGPITDDDKQDQLILFLSKLFEEKCLQNNDDSNIVMTSYLTDVWFPEVIIFALQKTQRIGHKRAEEMFVSEEKKAMEITSGALDIHLPYYLTEEEKRELLDNVPKRAARQLGFSYKELGLS